MNSLKLPFVAKLTLGLLSILMLGYLLVIGKFVIAPFFLAFLLALLFLPFSDFLEKKLRFPRSLSTLSSMIIIMLLLFVVGSFFTSQLTDFNEDIPLLEVQFNKTFDEFQAWIDHTFNVNSEKQFEYIDLALSRLLSSSGQILGVTFDIFISSFMFLFFFIFFFIFILNYRRILNRFIITSFSEEHRADVQKVVSEIRYMTKSYMTGLFIQVLIISTITFIVLSIIGVKYALLLAVLTGILNVIPYVGIVVSMLLSCLIAFATGTPIMSLYVVIGYAAIQFIDGNIILPFVVGSKVKINALITFLGILVGESLWGISGMLLCIPALAILKIIFDHVEPLQPWGLLLGEDKKPKREKRKIKITKKITIKEKD